MITRSNMPTVKKILTIEYITIRPNHTKEN